MNFVPMNDRVLVELVHADDVSEGGIIIPETAKEIPQLGKVVAIGAGGYKGGAFRPTELKEGDMVMFGKFAGSAITIDGEPFVILLEEDIFGRLAG